MDNRTSHQPRRRGRPSKSGAPPLSKETLVAAALEMTRVTEQQPLTFRALGARLGVDPAALYRCTPSKDALLLAVADGIYQQALEGFDETDDWRDDLYNLLSQVHQAYLEHPQVAVSAVTRITRLSAEMEFTETTLRLLEAAGMAASQAVLAYRALEDTMLAWTGFRANLLLMKDAQAEKDDWERVYRNADAKRYPRVVTQATPMTSISLQEGFEASINLLLDGITAQISRSCFFPAEAQTPHTDQQSSDRPCGGES